MHFARTRCELPQRLVGLLRIGVPPFRKRALTFPGVLLQDRSVGMLAGIDLSQAGVEQRQCPECDRQETTQHQNSSFTPN
jgi:hypothetical protein